MSVQPASLALEGGDPRASVSVDTIAADAARLERAQGHVVSFEEYMYYATITRADEVEDNKRFLAARGPRTVKTTFLSRFSDGKSAAPSPAASQNVGEIVTEKNGEGDTAAGSTPGLLARYSVTGSEQKHASRAMRTASWGTIFYLITTDIIGPSGIPWSFAQMGYGPGAALFTVFGGLSVYSGWILYTIYLALDSDRYPLHGYGDFFFRMFGPGARHFVNIAQALQQLLTVSAIILSNGQAISQISRGPVGDNLGICFIVCLVIFMVCGFVLGQIRTLQRFGWIANFAVWTNIIVVCICLGTAANSPPNYAAVEATYGLAPGEPIQTFAGTPPSGKATGGDGFIGSLNGLNQAVYAYGGAMLFAAFLAEMRNPLDFWKALIAAEAFIYTVYMFFGIFVYSFHGQYTYNPVQQGIVQYNYQTACNIMWLLSGLVAAALYGNIGLKVVYVEVFQELLHFPPLTERMGKVWWACLIPIYWVLAFCVCSAVPQFTYVSGLIGALFILSFTYTFPAWLAVGFWVKKEAIIEDEERFDPSSRTYNYVDQGWKRWRRGFMKRPLFNLFNIIYCLGAMVTCALGCYSSIEGLIGAFSGGQATSFSCDPPL